MLLALLLAPAAHAEIATCPYHTAHAEQVLDVADYDYDSDWVPADGAIQVRLQIHAGNTVSIAMEGDARHDWASGQVCLEGHEDGGDFELDLGLSVTTSLRFDIMGIQWEGELGDPIDFGIFDAATFRPYLLDGNPDRPLHVVTEVPSQTLVEYDAIDLLVASATVLVDISGTVETDFATTSVTVTPDDGNPAVALVTEDLPVALAFADGAAPAGAEAALEGDIAFVPDLSAWPSVVIDVLGTQYTLATFEIPIDLPPVEATWQFAPESLAFDRPSGSTDDTGGDPAGEDPADGDPVGGGTCGCGGGAGAPGMTLLLALAALAARRRTSPWGPSPQVGYSSRLPGSGSPESSWPASDTMAVASP